MNLTKKLIAVVLCISTVLCFASCSKANLTPVFTYEDTQITSDYYSLILSYQKGYYCQIFNYYYGVDLTANPAQWDTEYSEGVTLADQITADINDYCRMVLVCNYLAKQYGISLTDEDTLNEIEDTVSDYTLDYGGEDMFAVELAKMGADVATFRKFLNDSYTISLVEDYLYGENGTQKVPAADVEAEFLAKYHKVDSMSFSFYVVNEEDSSDYSLYQHDYTDNEIVAYFLQNYAKCNYLYYKQGTDESDEDYLARVNEIFASLQDGTKTFADVKGDADGANADWVAYIDTLGTDIFDTLKSSQEGAWALVNDDSGLHIVCKQTLQESDMTDDLKSTVLNYMSKQHIIDYANAYLEKVKNGEAVYGEELDTEFYSVFVDDTLFTDDDMDEEILKAYNACEVGEYFIVDNSEGIFVLYKDEVKAADAKTEYTDSYYGTTSTYYADIESELISDAFLSYISSYYDSVKQNDTELSKYDIRTAIEFYDN